MGAEFVLYLKGDATGTGDAGIHFHPVVAGDELTVGGRLDVVPVAARQVHRDLFCVEYFSDETMFGTTERKIQRSQRYLICHVSLDDYQ